MSQEKGTGSAAAPALVMGMLAAYTQGRGDGAPGPARDTRPPGPSGVSASLPITVSFPSLAAPILPDLTAPPHAPFPEITSQGMLRPILCGPGGPQHPHPEGLSLCPKQCRPWHGWTARSGALQETADRFP